MIKISNQSVLKKVYSSSINYVDASYNQHTITHNLNLPIHLVVVNFQAGAYPVYWRWDNGGVWGMQFTNAVDRMSINLLLGLTGNGNQNNVIVDLLSYA